MRRLLFAALVVSAVLPDALSWAQAPGTETTPNGRATLELILPAGATSKVDGVDIGSERTYRVKDMKPKLLQRLKMDVTFAGGKQVQRLVDIIPGQHVRMPVAEPDAVRAETYVAGSVSEILALALSDDGRYLVTTSSGHAVVLWDMKLGRVIRTFPGHTGAVNAVSISRDGKLILTGSSDLTAALWDAATGEKLQTFKGHFGEIWGVALSPDARFVLTGSADKTAILWNADTGERIRTFEGHRKDISSVAYSPTGKQIVTGSFDNNAIVWSPEDGSKLFTLTGHRDWVMAVIFNHTGDKILTGSNDNTSVLWDAATGKKIFGTKAHENDAYGVAISRDEYFSTTADRDQFVGLWDAKNGKKLRTLVGHQNEVTSSVFSPDNRLMFSGSRDGTVKIWDVATGEEVADMIGGDDDHSWAVTTPEGLLDGSEGGRVIVNYRFAERIPASTIDQLFNGYFYPGLLTAISDGQRPQPKVRLNLEQPPKVKFVGSKVRQMTTPMANIAVDAEDAGGGVGDIAVYQNGARVKPTVEKKKDDKTSHFTFQLPLVPGENQIRVTVANSAGIWESRPAETNYVFKGQLDRKPRLFVLAFAINESGKAMLKYPADDLQKMLQILDSHGGLYEKIEIARIDDFFDGLKQIKLIQQRAEVQDTIIVYASGFVPSFEKAEPDRENALRRIMILDGVASKDNTALGNSTATALRGDLERIARRDGFYVIAAATPDEKLSSRLGHGVLTYALLAALKEVSGGPLEETHLETKAPNHLVDINDWFAFACAQIPQILDEIPGSQAVVERSSQTGRFPILSMKTK